MRKTLLIAAALVLAGCGGQKKAPASEGGMAADSAGTMNMSHDSMAAPMSSDTTMARDTTKK
jgi:hypothetical protein